MSNSDFIIDGWLCVKGYTGNNPNVEIPEKAMSIGSSAFKDNTNIKAVTIPENVFTIESNAFSGCTSLTQINLSEGLDTIQSSAFEKCSGLKNIFIPGSVSDIWFGAFRKCSGLENISVSRNNKVYHSANNCLINTEEKMLIAGCKNSKIPNDGSVKKIDDYAFEGCEGLKSITIPDGVTSIGDSVFDGCVGLTNINIADSVRSLGDYVFSGCTNLTKITIPYGVRSIGKSAFWSCKNLVEITIPETVTEIGEDAFWCSNRLVIKCAKDSFAFKYAEENEIETEIISEDNAAASSFNADNLSSAESQTEIAFNRFEANYKNDNYPSNNEESDFNILSDLISINNKDKSQLLVNNQWTFVVPYGVEYETDCEMEDQIPGGVSLTGNFKPLVLKGIEEYGDYLLVAGLEKHYDFFGNYTTVIDCKYDNRVINEGAEQEIISDSDDFYVDIIKNRVFLFGIFIDVRVRGDNIEPFNFSVKVKAVDDYNQQLTYDTMFEIAKSIKKYGKGETTNLNNQKTAANNSDFIVQDTTVLKYLGKNSEVEFPEDCTEIADNICSGRKDIVSIVIPYGYKTVGSRTFENCFSLEKVYMPYSIEHIGDYAFADCHKLRYLELGTRLKSIESSAFTECFVLNNLELPGTIEYIASFAFKNCRAFTRMVIPENCKSIGMTAFLNCSNLEYLYIPESVTEIQDNFMDQTPFDGCNMLTVHCKKGSYAEEYCKSHSIRYISE